MPGPANALHDDIRKIGKGRYSFWHGQVYLSSSDNTDPRINGRKYEISYPETVGTTLAWGVYGLTALISLVGLWGAASFLRQRNKELDFPFALRIRISEIHSEDGFSYIAPGGYPQQNSQGGRSAVCVLEDGVPLAGPLNAPHDEIIKTGKGRYSVSHSRVCFSSSDNTDPRTNGRRYEVVFPAGLVTWAKVLFRATISHWGNEVAFINKPWISVVLVLLYMLSLIVYGLSCAVYLNRQGALSILPWQKESVTDIQQEEGVAFIAPTRHPELSSHDVPSRARLLEDGILLPGPANAVHDSIRKIGEGQYSFWHGNLCFSSSDNTDPRRNGRTYSIWYPGAVEKELAWKIYGFSILIWSATAFLRFLARRREKPRHPPFPRVLASLQRASTKVGFAFDRAATFKGSSVVYSFLFWGLPFLLFLLLYCLNIPAEIGMSFRLYPQVAICLAPLFFLFIKGENRTSRLINLGLVSTVIALPLFAAWASGWSNGESFIGGFIPISDANGYFISAEQLNLGYRLSDWGTRRPLSHGFLGVIYFLSGRNLPVTLALLAILCSISIYMSVIEIKRMFGPAAATLYVMVILLFFRRFVGTTLSENLGIILGTLSLGVLIRGLSRNSEFLILTGLFLLSLGLNARAGCFFVLLLLVAWGWHSFSRRSATCKRLLLAGLMVFSVALGFLINSSLIKLIGSHAQTMPFANFAPVIYGLAFGGDYTLALNNPAYQGISEKEQAEKIYADVFEAVKDKPVLLVNGTFRAWKMFFDGYVFSFIQDRRMSLILLALSGITIFLLLFDRSIESRFMLFYTIGVVLSVPFVPPWDADSMRAYAATIPFIAMVPGYGLYKLSGVTKGILTKGFTCEKQKTSVEKVVIKQSVLRNPIILYSLLIVFLSFPAPIILHKVAALLNPVASTAYWVREATPGRLVFRIHREPGNFLNIVTDAATRVRIPDVRLSDFALNTVPNVMIMYPAFGQILANLKENFSIKFDSNVHRYVIIRTDELDSNTDAFYIGKPGSAGTFPYVEVVGMVPQEMK